MRCFQNFYFLGLKNLTPVSFLGAPTHADIIEFWNFLLQLKDQRSGSKTLCSFSIILILKGTMTFQSQRVHVFCWTKLSTLVKMKQNRKWKIPHTVLERRTLCFSSYSNHKLKMKMLLVGAHKRKKRSFIYFTVYFVRKEF